MTHILKNTHSELKRTHDVLVNFKYSSWKGFLFDFFGAGFKKTLISYAFKKEEILLNYSSLYSDIKKDIEDSQATPTNIEHVRESLVHITDTISECGKLLDALIAHTQKQEEILEYEKKFFAELLLSFQNDLLLWTQKHEKEIFGEISQIEKLQNSTPLEEGVAVLEMQKKRLEIHIENLKKL